ncbi:MAG: asparagine synthetase B [Clostridiales bacterium]|nr:asparagine synthetase B [Clostridiales bacterium]
MCGIAGFWDYKNNFKANAPYYEDILDKMQRALIHRGSDQSGLFLRSTVGMSHARLSIRDIEGGLQPMVRTKDGAEYAICYNGEIYNTQELLYELKSAGYVMETTSDTEVILYAYMHYGQRFVTRLNGIFAFAIWDGAQQALYLYRDRVGVKPLFYTFTAAAYQTDSADCRKLSAACAAQSANFTNSTPCLVFASEPKGLFAHPLVSPEINLTSLQQVLGIGPARTMGNGVFKGVSEVLPGHYLRISSGGVSDETYWDLESRPHRDNYATTVDKTSFLVRDAVQRQMVSDVPVCTFLSGGIDSSIVTALAYQYLSEHGEKLNTFSFDFTGNKEYFKSNSFQPEQDRPYVDIMRRRYQTNHTFLFCEKELLVEKLDDAVMAKDLPGMTDVDASLLYFCSKVKEHNKVALTGECADEIFGGYPWFYRKELLETDGFPWSGDISARTLLLNDEWIQKLDLENYAHEEYLASLAQVPQLPDSDSAGTHPRTNKFLSLYGKTPLVRTVSQKENMLQRRRRSISYLNIKWFMQTLLDRMDRTSMYSGLEARVPFADHRIVEYLFNVPWEMKYQNGVEKALLRDATKDLLPSELLRRRKSPYPKPYDPGYEQLLTSKMTEILRDESSPILPMLDKDKVLEFLQAPKEYGRPWFGQLMAGPQLIAYFIQLNTWMEYYQLKLP